MLFFLLGFLSCLLLFGVLFVSNSNLPFGTGLVVQNRNVMPSNRISDDNITVFNNRIVIRVANATVSNYANSGSMEPILGKGANGIRIVPRSTEDIRVGDIVSYKFGKMLVVHRVIKKGRDNKGVYFIMQGDDNIMNDGKIRFGNIKYVTVGILW